MKINPDDPASKMTIRLTLATEFTAAFVGAWSATVQANITDNLIGLAIDAGLELADGMIARANRDEGSDDGK